jgi:hypothetical protein
MKVILKKKSLYTAEAVSEDGTTTVYFSRTNSSWHDNGIGSKSVGDAVEVVVQKSDKGRDFVTRLTADKFLDVMKIENAMMQGQILAKQAREGA